MRRIRRVPLLALLLAAALPASADAASERARLKDALTAQMRQASSQSSAFVANATNGKTYFGWRSDTRRILASNTKIFTIGAALTEHGVAGRLETRVLGLGTMGPTGVFAGDLYLQGGGDPSFGSRAYNSGRYGDGATANIEVLAQELYDGGLRRVTGGIVGDESRFDSRRGTAYSNFQGSGDIGGPLSALAYNHGRNGGGSFQIDPPTYAANALAGALEALGVQVDGSARSGPAPNGAVELADVDSPPMSWLTRRTGVPSENFFAEILIKGLASSGTTADGAARVRRYARSREGNVKVYDGSGLSTSNRATPREVVEFLLDVREHGEFNALYKSLPVSGRTGTLADRLRSRPAYKRCRAKTGTLEITGVSTLSGYCKTLGGDVLVYSILMNRIDYRAGRRIQDRMVQAIAGFDG